MNSAPLIDHAVFGELQANAGEEFVAELVGTFAEEAPGILQEMRAALAAGAAERFRRAAHSLKSNSNTFGASHLAELARALELGGMPAGTARLEEIEQEFVRTLAALQDLARG
jgi:histidine phosphotransfer protein HptB